MLEGFSLQDKRICVRDTISLLESLVKATWLFESFPQSLRSIVLELHPETMSNHYDE